MSTSISSSQPQNGLTPPRTPLQNVGNLVSPAATSTPAISQTHQEKQGNIPELGFSHEANLSNTSFGATIADKLIRKRDSKNVRQSSLCFKEENAKMCKALSPISDLHTSDPLGVFYAAPLVGLDSRNQTTLDSQMLHQSMMLMPNVPNSAMVGTKLKTLSPPSMSEAGVTEFVIWEQDSSESQQKLVCQSHQNVSTSESIAVSTPIPLGQVEIRDSDRNAVNVSVIYCYCGLCM